MEDLRLEVGSWNREPSRAVKKRQEAFDLLPIETRAEIVRTLRPHLCKVCWMRYVTSEEAYDCCQKQIDNTEIYVSRDMLDDEQKARIKVLFSEGWSMMSVAAEMHMSDYRLRHYWFSLRDEFMEDHGMSSPKQYHYWRRRRLRELGYKPSGGKRERVNGKFVRGSR